MVFQFLISEIVVLRAKRGSIKSRNYFLVYLDSCYEPSSRNLVAKVARAVVFNTIFDLQFSITSIWTCSLFSSNIKVLIEVLTIETELNNFPLALIVATELWSLSKRDFKLAGSGPKIVIIFVEDIVDNYFS